jgi:hypothetical protein
MRLTLKPTNHTPPAHHYVLFKALTLSPPLFLPNLPNLTKRAKLRIIRKRTN